MKKSFSLILLICVFALPAFAQTAVPSSGQVSGQAAAQTANQTSQSTKTTTTKTTTEPVQVNVTINNSASAQGNTQTTTIDNTQNQSSAPAPASQGTAGTVGAKSLFGDYASSPYHSNMQVEMLRNSVWTSLVPRKKLYQDPAAGNAPTRYYGKKSSTKSKSQTAQANKTKSGTTKNNTSKAANIQANSTQNINLDAIKEKLASGQIILLEQKDGEICIPLEQFTQLTGQKPEQIPGQVQVQGTTAPAAAENGSVNNSDFYSPVNSANEAHGSAAPAGQAADTGSSSAPFSPANSVNPATPANSANAVGSAASPANPPRTVTPLGGGTENDIFAIPSNPFDPVSPATPANPAITGNNSNPQGQGFSGQNPMAREPLAPQVSAQQGNTASQRDISVTQNTAGTQNTANAQMTVGTQTNP